MPHHRQVVTLVDHRLALASLMRPNATAKKIILQSELPNLGLHILDHRPHLCFLVTGKHIFCPLLQLLLPCQYLALMYLILGR